MDFKDYYSTQETAFCLGISTRQIAELVSSGILEKEGRGKFNLPRTIQRYIAYKEKGAAGNAAGYDPAKYKQDQSRKLKNEADILEIKKEQEELELEKKKGNLIETEIAIELINRSVSKLSNDINQFARIVSPDLVGKDEEEIEHTLDTHINNTIRKSWKSAMIDSSIEIQEELDKQENAKRQGAGEKKQHTAKAKKRAKYKKK